MFSREKGFTLVELMIVVVIIGILASIAIPKFSSLIGKAKATEAKSVLGQIVNSETTYKMTYEDFLDFAETDTSVPELAFEVPPNAKFTYKFVGAGMVIGIATAIEVGDLDGNGAIATDGLTMDTEKTVGGVGDMVW